jgi:heme exporter protein C
MRVASRLIGTPSSPARGLRSLALLSAAALGAGYGLAFFSAPIEADQGFVQKIFYLHVPLAITTLVGFVAGGLLAAQHLRTGDRRWDVRSYVAIHVSTVFAVAALGTGSIWARASWGHWWVWQEPTLVSFLIVFLLYACYQPLRFAIVDPERQARYASVFAIVAAAFVPVNFVAVRMAQSFTHPRVLTDTGGSMPASMRLAFVACLGAIGLLHVTLCRLELDAKRVRMRARRMAMESERAAFAAPPPAAPAPPSAPPPGVLVAGGR